MADTYTYVADTAVQVGDVLVLTFANRLTAEIAKDIKDRLAERGIPNVVIIDQCSSAVVVKRASDG